MYGPSARNGQWLTTVPRVLHTHPIDFVFSPLQAHESANLHFPISQVNEAL